MNYNELLDKFMLYKTKELEKINFPSDKFYLACDQKYLLSLNMEIAKKTYFTLRDNVMNENFIGGLSCFTCPFCIILKNDCFNCVYGKYHHECSRLESTFYEICSFFVFGNINIYKIYTPEFYRVFFLKEELV